MIYIAEVLRSAEPRVWQQVRRVASERFSANDTPQAKDYALKRMQGQQHDQLNLWLVEDAANPVLVWEWDAQEDGSWA